MISIYAIRTGDTSGNQHSFALEHDKGKALDIATDALDTAAAKLQTIDGLITLDQARNLESAITQLHASDFWFTDKPGKADAYAQLLDCYVSVVRREIRKVSEVPSDMALLTDSQDLKALREFYPQVEEGDSAFVRVVEGEYIEVYGFHGSVPYDNKDVLRIDPGWPESGGYIVACDHPKLSERDYRTTDFDSAIQAAQNHVWELSRLTRRENETDSESLARYEAEDLAQEQIWNRSDGTVYSVTGQFEVQAFGYTITFKHVG